MEEVHTCEKCHKTFAEMKYLKQHMSKRIPCDKVHNCHKCKKHFTTAQQLRNHLNRKNPCVPNEVPVIAAEQIETKCKFCGNEYYSKYTLKRHMKTCNIKNDTSILIEMVEKLSRQVNALQHNQQIQTQVINNNNNLTVNQNLYVNVTICNFGGEDLSRLDQQGVIDLLKGQVEDFIPKMVEYIHANPKYPEFHNVFYDPVRKKALIFTQNQNNQLTWQFEDIERVSKQITDKIKDHIHPLNGPYFNSLSKMKDSETANKIPQILCTNWQTPVILEGTKESLSKVVQNEGFMNQVSILE